jgi:hypothetical protein
MNSLDAMVVAWAAHCSIWTSIRSASARAKIGVPKKYLKFRSWIVVAIAQSRFGGPNQYGQGKKATSAAAAARLISAADRASMAVATFRSSRPVARRSLNASRR